VSAIYTRGGIPRHVNGTTVNPAAVEEWTWTGGVANSLWFHNAGGGAITVSFSQEDADAGIGIDVAAGVSWLIPAEIVSFFTKSVAAQAFQSVAFLRRG